MRLIIIILFILTSINLNLNANIEEDEYVNPKIQPSKYKPEDFYGTWVAVKVKFFACPSRYLASPSKDFYGDWKEIGESLGKKVIINEKFFSNKALKRNENITDFKYFTYIHDGYGGYSSYIDGDYNKYDLFTVWGSQFKKPNEGFGTEDTFIIVNKNKIITSSHEYGFMYILIREEEAVKLNKYTIEVPYNFVLTRCYMDIDEYIKKRRLSIIDKELDVAAKKLKAKGKYNVTRAYVGRSAIDGEE